MGKLILYTAVSLDGYIAGIEDDLSWLTVPKEYEPAIEGDYIKFLESIEQVIMGNTTYRYVVNEGIENPYPEKNTYVFTRDHTLISESIHYINEDPVTFTSKLLSETTGNVWLCGGGKVNSMMAEAGLIDEIQLTAIPVTIGEGVRLFHGKGALEHYNLKDVERFGNIVKLTYIKKV